MTGPPRASAFRCHDINVEEHNVKWEKVGSFWWGLLISCQWAHLRLAENRGALHQMSPYNSMQMNTFDNWIVASKTDKHCIKWVLIMTQRRFVNRRLVNRHFVNPIIKRLFVNRRLGNKSVGHSLNETVSSSTRQLKNSRVAKRIFSGIIYQKKSGLLKEKHLVAVFI